MKLIGVYPDPAARATFAKYRARLKKEVVFVQPKPFVPSKTLTQVDAARLLGMSTVNKVFNFLGELRRMEIQVELRP